MSKPRQSRFIRKEVADPLKLTPRDIALLRDVADFRFINTEQLLALHEGSRRNLVERLSRLYQNHYLDRPKVQKKTTLATSHLVYSLGRKGAELLAKDAGEREVIYRRLREVERTLPLMAHGLMISQFRTCLTLAAKEQGVKIARWSQGYDLKETLRAVHGDNPSLVPDAFFTLEDKGEVINFFLEADRGNMPPERFVRKLKVYWSWRSDEKLKTKLRLSRFRVLTITPSQVRSDNLRKAGKGGDPRGDGSLMFLFAPETRYNIVEPKAILQTIWQSPKDDAFHSILE